MSTLNEDVMQAVKAKLPEIQAVALAEYIKDAEVQKRLLAAMKPEFDKLKKYEATLQEVETSRSRVKQNLITLEAKTADLVHKEQLNELSKKCAEEKVNLAREFFSIVFRNVDIRQTIFGNKTIVDNNGYPAQCPFDETKETHVE